MREISGPWNSLDPCLVNRMQVRPADIAQRDRQDLVLLTGVSLGRLRTQKFERGAPATQAKQKRASPVELKGMMIEQVRKHQDGAGPDSISR